MLDDTELDEQDESDERSPHLQEFAESTMQELLTAIYGWAGGGELAKSVSRQLPTGLGFPSPTATPQLGKSKIFLPFWPFWPFWPF